VRGGRFGPSQRLVDRLEQECLILLDDADVTRNKR
jgi:hypothetical protein